MGGVFWRPLPSAVERGNNDHGMLLELRHGWAQTTTRPLVHPRHGTFVARLPGGLPGRGQSLLIANRGKQEGLVHGQILKVLASDLERADVLFWGSPWSLRVIRTRALMMSDSTSTRAGDGPWRKDSD
jgi:hypothetical protein